MSKAWVFTFALLAAGSAIAGEEESVQLKVTVEGMSCPTGCAPKVAKGLSSLQGAKDVKLEDFDKGLFTVSFDPKVGVKPAAFQKSLGEYKVKKIEATLAGTIGLKDKELTLTTASGTTYTLTVGAAKACCADEKPEAKKDAPKQKEECETCPITAALKAKVETLAKENKSVKITGLFTECCEVSITVTAIDELKKATN